MVLALMSIALGSGGAPTPRYEVQVGFSTYDRTETLTNVPLLVTLGSHVTGFSYADFVSPADGADLRFRRADNDQELNYEIEEWNTNGTSYAWVQLDELATNTAIYAMWGNAGWSTPPACRTNGAVWSSDYEAVWHMNETVTDEASLADAHRDFTSHGRDGNQAGNAHTTGRVAQGQYWDGTDDYIGIADLIISTQNLAISTWMRPDALSGYGAILNHNGWSVGNIHYQFYNATISCHQNAAFDTYLSGSFPSSGEWRHVVTTFDRSAGGTDGVVKFYVDGELEVSYGGLSTTLNPSPAPGRIGAWDSPTDLRYFQGAMDEFRILNSVPSSNRVWATWMNMASNDTFNSYGTVTYHPATPIHYVSLNGGNVSPYDSWATAATNIQDAVDAAIAGDTVRVTNGTYNLPTTLIVSNALTLASVNGPDDTTISGGNSFTCLNLANHAVVVDGFTIRDAYTYNGNGGGVACSDNTPVITNCILTANTAFHGAGAFRGTLRDCQIINNTCRYSGGGTCLSILYNCTVSNNTCEAEGGGVYYGSATDCTITDNAGGWGGGTAFANLLRCTVSGNRATAYYGGGVHYGTANNCIITDNEAPDHGGGSSYATCNNCVISGNRSGTSGAGSYYSNLSNCTVTDNTAAQHAGGVHYGNVYNSIVVDNYVGGSVSNWNGGAYTYTCTTPLPAGVGNITDDPVLLSRSHIATNSPCIGAGSASYPTGTDIDGEAWNSPPSIGCDEVNAHALNGPLTVSINAKREYAYPNIQVAFVAEIDGKPSHTAWSLGPENAYRISSSWPAAGSYPVILTAYNTDNPGGIAATVTVHVIAETTHYVSPSGGHVVPYTSWANAATSIPFAVDVASDGGSVIVADGAYTVSSEIKVETEISLSSVNGPDVTTVDAGGSCRVFNPGAQDCTISGFTITGGSATKGGGVYCLDATPIINNCTISDNDANNGAGVCRGTLTQCVIVSNTASHVAGGTYYSSLRNCLVVGNYAEETAGGCYYSTLVNCTVVSNSASMSGSGVVGGTISNSISYHNVGWWDPNHSGGTWTHSCTIPVPYTSSDIITNDPQFVSLTSGDYRLSPTSPCIDSGTGLVSVVRDLDGTARPLDGNNDDTNTVDMGCYEYAHPAVDSDGDTMTDRWESDGGLDPTINDATDNPDGDPHTNREEFTADTDPTDSNDYFRVTEVSVSSPAVIEFDSSTNRLYSLYWRSNLIEGVWSNLVGPRYGTGGMDSMQDTNARGSSAFYRLQVEEP